MRLGFEPRSARLLMFTISLVALLSYLVICQLVYEFQVSRVRSFGPIFQVKKMRPSEESYDLLGGEKVSYFPRLETSC